MDAFPSDTATFAALPEYLDCIAVRHACIHAAGSPTAAERSFLAVMAWGYGRVRYGPFRVRRVHDAAPNAGVQLQSAAGAADAGRPVEAYTNLGDHGTARLPYLGPAFGTKFLYFCSPAGGRPALILDRLVARWLRESVGLVLNEVRWSVSTYASYLKTMSGWADELCLTADELEACIFSTQAGPATPNGLSDDHERSEVGSRRTWITGALRSSVRASRIACDVLGVILAIALALGWWLGVTR